MQPPIARHVLGLSLALAISASSTGAAQAPSPSDKASESLSDDDWARIREAYEVGRHAAPEAAGGTPSTVDGRGARCPLTIAPTAQRAYVKASNTDVGDYFANCVSMSGDTVVVGAPGEDSSATGVNGNQSDNGTENAGAAYVFVRNGTVWSQEAYLKASNTDAGDSFADSVAVSGSTVLVGAHGENSNATGVNGNQSNNTSANAGAAYVFVRNGSVWSQEAYLKGLNTRYDDNFGYSVSVFGDTAVVGARFEDRDTTGVNNNPGTSAIAKNSGAAYVFVRSGTTWSEQAYLKASNTDPNDHFGQSVSIAGDTTVIGAPWETSNATGVNGNQAANGVREAGAAYVFVRSGTVWSQQAYLKASNTDPFDRFGDSVSVSGGTVVIGAAREDSTATGVNGYQDDEGDTYRLDTGAVYVFAPYAPTLESIEPAKGPFGGGNTVRVVGGSFTPSTTVDFGGVPSPAVTFVSSTELVVEVPRWPLAPRGIRGPIHRAAVFTVVDVSAANGPRVHTLPGAYTYEEELRRGSRP